MKISRSSAQINLETITIEHDKEITKERYIHIYIYIYIYTYTYEVVGSKSTRANFQYGIERPQLNNEYHVCLLLHTHDCLINSIRNVRVATNEGPSPKLALSKGGS